MLPIEENEADSNGDGHVIRYNAGDGSGTVGICGVRRRADLGRFSDAASAAKDAYDFSTASQFLSGLTGAVDQSPPNPACRDERLIGRARR